MTTAEAFASIREVLTEALACDALDFLESEIQRRNANSQVHTLEVSRIDATLVEELSEATIRSGDIPLAIQGFSLTLRLRAATNSWEERREHDRRQP